MALDYFLLVFISSFGVYQIASIPAKLEGLWLFRFSTKGQYIFGVLAIVGAFGWFFAAEERNVQHTLEGSEQLGLFLAAIVSSYVVTAILASIIQAGLGIPKDTPIKGKQHEQGVETLKTTTVFGGIVSSLRKKREDKS